RGRFVGQLDDVGKTRASRAAHAEADTGSSGAAIEKLAHALVGGGCDLNAHEFMIVRVRTARPMPSSVIISRSAGLVHGRRPYRVAWLACSGCNFARDDTAVRRSRMSSASAICFSPVMISAFYSGVSI